jgi:hypothetical protein
VNELVNFALLTCTSSNEGELKDCLVPQISVCQYSKHLKQKNVITVVLRKRLCCYSCVATVVLLQLCCYSWAITVVLQKTEICSLFET